MRSVVLLIALLLTAALPRPAHALVVLGWHDVRERIADGEPDTAAITTRNLAMQLDWLRAHGYVPVSAQAVRDARAGRTTLPAKAVLLTFDGGWRSAYTQAYPLLRAFGWPAVVAVPTARIDGVGDVRVDGRTLPRSDFLTWADLKAMQASGLVEIATQGHDLATPIAADPQGDLLPAAVSRRWAGGYESEGEYRERIRRDLAASADLLARHVGRRPQLVVWPDGGNGAARAVAESLGMPLAIGMDGRSGTADLRYSGAMKLDGDPSMPVRLVMHENPGASDLAYELRRDIRRDGIRAVHVSLDGIAAADAAATGGNVDALVERIRSLRPSHVFLDAFADTNGDGTADAAWFPTTRLPVRADLFTHVAARLAARAGVDVFAWVPALPGDAAGLVDDLAAATPIAGVVFADRAGTTDARALAARALAWRPGLVTVRAVAAPVTDDAAWAQSLPALQASSDFVAVMLPGARAATGAIDRRVADVARIAGGLDRAIFVVDAGDAGHAVPAAELEARVRRVIASGGRHVAYSRDDPSTDRPPLDPARAAISARAFPYLER